MFQSLVLSPSLVNLERTAVVLDVVKLPFEMPELHGKLQLMLDHQARMATACHYHQWVARTVYVLGFVQEKWWGKLGG